MKTRKLLTFLFILSSNVALAHQDFWMTKDFGNVKVRIKTGYQYEEIKKAWIIGELASRLCQKLSYKQSVFIDFNHYYVGNCDPDYFLSFDDGSIIETWNTEKPKAFLKQNSLVVREVSRQFSPSVTLRLLEYSILNIDKIKGTQKLINYNQNYCQWKIKSIDTVQAKNIGHQALSQAVKEVLGTRVYRLDDELGKTKSDISYFFQGNKYHIFYNEYKVEDSVLLVVDNVYQFENISFNEAIAFVTDSTFFYIKGVNGPYSSKKKVIEQINDNYQPFKITKVGVYKVAFSFWYYDKREGIQPKERNVLYKIDTGELIQDLNESLGLR